MHRSKSRKTRARVEHVFGAQVIAPGSRIGIVQARAKIRGHFPEGHNTTDAP